MLTIKDLNRIKEVVKVSTLCRLAKIPPATINDKMKQERELRIDESQKLEAVLNSVGLKYESDGKVS